MAEILGTMPRLVRRRPLLERITSMLNPMDFLLWLSEEIETRDWDSGLVGTQLGLGLNFLFLIVRANSGSKPASDDIFGDESSSSWPSILVSFLRKIFEVYFAARLAQCMLIKMASL